MEPCLNETEKGELQFMIRVSAGQLTFQQFWAKLAARYGEEANACARRRWRELTLNTAGKVTASDWRDFQVRFCEIFTMCLRQTRMRRTKFYWPSCQLLLRYGWLKNRKKENSNHTRLFLGPMPGYEEDEVSLSVETRLGQRPRRIEKRQNDTFVIEFTRKKTSRKCYV